MKEELNTLRKEIPHGGIKKIAENLELSPYFIGEILRGNRKSPRLSEIIQEAAKIIKQHKAEKQKAQEALQEALSI